MNIKELDELVNSFDLQELEERIELACFPGTCGTSTGVVWTF